MPADWFPTTARSVAAEELDGELVLYDPQARRLLVLNRSASEVWNRCDGTVSVAELIDDLAAAMSAPRADIADDVMTFLDRLRDVGVVVEHQPPPAEPAPVSPPRR
jgi:coenzyme PQQ biosynthesis protein PqqD